MRPSKARARSSLLARVVAASVLVLAVPALFQGCSGCTCAECFSAGVAQHTKHEAVKSYVYSAPLETTEKEIRAVVFERNGSISTDHASRTSTLSATWTNGSVTRYRFSPIGKERYTLTVEDVHTYDSPDGGTETRIDRDLETELRIAMRVDPAWAAEIAESAKARAERAERVGRGCDRGCELGCRACETCAKISK
jgi:hypothetical protein